MTLLHDAYTALLADLTHKIGNEIHWEDEDGDPITVELVDIAECKYIIRCYYKNGNKHWEEEYQDDKPHGKFVGWYENGNKRWEKEYQDGKRHGKAIWWYENGNKRWEREFQDNKPHGKIIWWYKNGNRELEYEYQDGELI